MSFVTCSLFHSTSTAPSSHKFRLTYFAAAADRAKHRNFLASFLLFFSFLTVTCQTNLFFSFIFSTENEQNVYYFPFTVATLLYRIQPRIIHPNVIRRIDSVSFISSACTRDNEPAALAGGRSFRQINRVF